MLRVQLICGLYAPSNKCFSMILVQSLLTVHSFSSALKATLSLTVVKFTETYKNCLLHITFDEHIVQKATVSIYRLPVRKEQVMLRLLCKTYKPGSNSPLLAWGFTCVQKIANVTSQVENEKQKNHTNWLNIVHPRWVLQCPLPTWWFRRCFFS